TGEPDEQPILPARHAGTHGKPERAPRKEERGRHDFELPAKLAGSRKRSRHVWPLHKAETKSNPRKSLAHPRDLHALGRIDSRERRIIDRQNDIVFVQHLVVLQAVHQRSRCISRIAGEKHGRSWDAMRRPLLKTGHERIKRHLAFTRLIKSRMPRRQVYITVITTHRALAGSSRPRAPSAGWHRGR